MSGEFVPTLKTSDVSEGAMLAVDVKEKHILVARIGGEVHAVSGTCTHEEADLGLGFRIEERVVCPLHFSQFDLKDGRVENPPAMVPLQRFNVKIEDGTILIEI
jgi:nitrite reductase/ring-hydroxylating ferredoxin subunit